MSDELTLEPTEKDADAAELGQLTFLAPEKPLAIVDLAALAPGVETVDLGTPIPEPAFGAATFLVALAQTHERALYSPLYGPEELKEWADRYDLTFERFTNVLPIHGLLAPQSRAVLISPRAVGVEVFAGTNRRNFSAMTKAVRNALLR